jgi:hypothetical protein
MSRGVIHDGCNQAIAAASQFRAHCVTAGGG